MKCCINVHSEHYQVENSLKCFVCLFLAAVGISDCSIPGGASKLIIETSNALALPQLKGFN